MEPLLYRCIKTMVMKVFVPLCTLPSRSYPLAPRGVGVSRVRRSPCSLFYTLHPGHSHLTATTVRKSRPEVRGEFHSWSKPHCAVHTVGFPTAGGTGAHIRSHRPLWSHAFARTDMRPIAGHKGAAGYGGVLSHTKNCLLTTEHCTACAVWVWGAHICGH